jgi:hypothetical protein
MEMTIGVFDVFGLFRYLVLLCRFSIFRSISPELVLDAVSPLGKTPFNIEMRASDAA